MKKLYFAVSILACLTMAACKKNAGVEYHYFEVGMRNHIADSTTDWRDSSFIIAVSSQQLLSDIQTELTLPVQERKNVLGDLAWGNAGYNNNAAHQFKWHLVENSIQLVNVSAELYDGRPYTDLDLNSSYWVKTVKSYCSWNSYIRKEIKSH